MKKLLFILLMAVTLTACNDSSEGSTSDDSLNSTIDSNNMNTMNATGDSGHMMGDSSHMRSDSSTMGDSLRR